MYNTDLPTRAELPTTPQLVRSTLIALATAAVILVTAVLPGEYGVDPTGIGRALGLTQMGEIKLQLAAEAERDAAAQATTAEASASPASIDESEAPTAPAQGRSDEMTFTLAPGEGAEIKLTMRAGERASFSWNVDQGVVNYDLHGDGGGRSIRYEQGRGVPSHSGEVEAAFDGNHGWFWRNRGAEPVTVTLRTNGQYSDLRRLI